jgi:hypothetical protein
MRISIFATNQNAQFQTCSYAAMEASVFRCPALGKYVQGFIAEDVSAEEDMFIGIDCPGCGQVHFVNPKTMKIHGEE